MLLIDQMCQVQYGTALYLHFTCVLVLLRQRRRLSQAVPPTRYKPQQIQTTELCACYEQPTPYVNPLIKKHPVEKEKKRKTNGKTLTQRMSTQKPYCIHTCSDALCVCAVFAQQCSKQMRWNRVLQHYLKFCKYVSLDILDIIQNNLIK